MNNIFSFNVVVLNMRIIYELVVGSFKSSLRIVLIFVDFVCIKCC